MGSSERRRAGSSASGRALEIADRVPHPTAEIESLDFTLAAREQVQFALELRKGRKTAAQSAVLHTQRLVVRKGLECPSEGVHEINRRQALSLEADE